MGTFGTNGACVALKPVPSEANKSSSAAMLTGMSFPKERGDRNDNPRSAPVDVIGAVKLGHAEEECSGSSPRCARYERGVADDGSCDAIENPHPTFC